ncbi:uncharacterized protein LOC101854645 [Aplysia californica]|uniref:Uncharacterized protein LOC101854645 n=1 Tax=Aplysia californica TaxID=6500 RepID=A0ABM0JTV8_APLCA|nr:uncharacterized protein LOC101854645 [Aplysia californica]XP_035826408.1 uncharacterized protein LOC101854645 [Aplysia californica]
MASLKNVLLKNPLGVVGSLRTLCYQKNFSGHDACATTSCCPARRAEKWVRTRSYSDDAGKFKVLTQSTMLMQDGNDIEELPILIRRVTRDWFPFTTHTYSGGSIREESEFEASFRQILHDCSSVSDVFRLLEVPSDRVRGYSAAFALQRLHVLKHLNTDWNQIHSFIRSAVMRELYDTVQDDVAQLSNQTLISLVECYLAADGFSPSCMDAVNQEIQCRLGDSTFSVEELLTLANILKCVKKELSSKSSPPGMPKTSTMTIAAETKSRFLSSNVEESGKNAQYFDKFCAKAQENREVSQAKCSSLLDDIWIHVGTRYSDMTEATLPLTMVTLTPENRSLVSLLEKPMQRVWPGLSAEGAMQCLDSLVQLKVYNPAILTQLGRWAYVNVHLVTPQLLLSFLNAFLHFHFLDQNLVRVIERCLSKRGVTVETDILALCVEYCRSQRFVSPVVMDVAARHFTQHGPSYEPLQLYAVLRAFGHLNFLPPQPAAFLKRVESCLSDRFSVIGADQLLEILGSFTFVGVLPHNFYRRISSDYFYSKVGDLKNPSKMSALMWLKVVKHAMALAWSPEVERRVAWVMGRRSKWSVFCYMDNQRIAIETLKSALSDILGERCHHVVPFYGCCAFYMDERGAPLPVSRSENGRPEPQGKVEQKFVIVLRSADHYSINTRQLLGAQAQRRSQLEQLGFTVIEVRAGEFRFYDGPDFLKDILSKHVDFSLVEPSAQTSSSLSATIRKDLPGWSEQSDEDFSTDDEACDPVLTSGKGGRPDGGSWKGLDDGSNTRDDPDD